METTEHRTVRRRASGFTLIELMITMAILAILASIALPTYRQYVIRSTRSAAQAAMLDIANREQQFLMANRTYVDGAALTASGYVLPPEVSDSYDFTITADATSFLITFNAKGGQAPDGNLTLDNLGRKTPADKWD